MKCYETGGHKANGDPCMKDVRQGFTRCNLHGAASPSAKIKAEQALALTRMPAIEALYRVVEQFEMNCCPTCNMPEGDTEYKRMIVNTAKIILDRTGFGPHATIALTNQSDGVLNLEMLTDSERAELTGLMAQVKAIKDAVRARQMGIITVQPAGLLVEGTTQQQP